MTPNQHGPLMPWATLMVQWPRQRVAKPRGGANPINLGPSSDCSLQLDCMKPELLVNAHQPRRVEYVLESCTRRPSHQGSRRHPKFALRIRVESVTGVKS